MMSFYSFAILVKLVSLTLVQSQNIWEPLVVVYKLEKISTLIFADFWSLVYPSVTLWGCASDMWSQMHDVWHLRVQWILVATEQWESNKETELEPG